MCYVLSIVKNQKNNKTQRCKNLVEFTEFRTGIKIEGGETYDTITFHYSAEQYNLKTSRSKNRAFCKQDTSKFPYP